MPSETPPVKLSAHAFLAQVLGFTTLILAAVAGANLAVDPFGIYPVPQRAGFNLQKAGQHGHDRMVKAYAMARLRPDVVMLGTSRVQYGLDPSDPALVAGARRPYNAGLLGSNVYAALRYLQHAHALGPVTTALVGLDPLMFDDSPAAAAAAGRDFLEARLRADPQGRPQLGLALEDGAATLLSYDALRLSARTLRKQASLVTDLLPNGQRAPAALHNFFAEAGSTRASFRQTELAYFVDFAAAVWPAAAPNPVATATAASASASASASEDAAEAAAAAAAPSSAFAHFDALLAFARQHHIRLLLYFTPQHVRLHEVARQAGMEAQINVWQLRVAEAVALANAAPPRGAAGEAGGLAGGDTGMSPPPIELWNMAQLTPFACEDVPSEQEGSVPLDWFWESTHARDRLGHLILTRLLAPAEAQVTPIVRGVGEPTSLATLEAQQRATAVALTAWESAHPQDVKEIAASGSQAAARSSKR